MGDRKKSIKVVLMAVSLAVSLFLSTQLQQVHGYNCNSVHGTNCYLVHQFNPIFSVNGLKGEWKALQVPNNPSWILSPGWVELPDLSFIEVGVRDFGTSDPQFYWGKNGAISDVWGSPADGSTHTFRLHDFNQNSIWNVNVDGVTLYSTAMSTAWSNEVKAGWEFTYTEATVKTNDFNKLSWGRPDTGWVWWKQGDGNHYAPQVHSGGFFVHYCGTGNEQWRHSQHGKDGQPITC